MFEMFSYPFMVRAVVVGLLVSLSASLLGVSLVLRRYSMIGDGLSHVGFGALSIATVLGLSPLMFTIPVVVVAAILLLSLSERKGGPGSDAMIALVASSSLSVGIMAISFVKGTNTDINNFLFGSLLAVSRSDAVFSVILSSVVLVSYILLYPRLFAVTFDPVFARSSGLNVKFYTMFLAVLAALTITLGMRMLGSLLISALIVFPAISSMRLFRRYRSVTISSAAISVVAFCIGISLSYCYGTPVGASIVIVNLAIFIVFSAAGSYVRRNRKVCK